MHMHAPASLAAQYDVRLGDACACLRSGSKACHNQVQYITASKSWLDKRPMLPLCLTRRTSRQIQALAPANAGAEGPAQCRHAVQKHCPKPRATPLTNQFWLRAPLRLALAFILCSPCLHSPA